MSLIDEIRETHGLRGEFLRWVVLLLILSGIISLVGIMGWQGYTYLQFGDWTPVSIIDGLQYLEFEWATTPDNWLGLHNILGWFHLGIGILLCTILVSILISAAE